MDEETQPAPEPARVLPSVPEPEARMPSVVDRQNDDPEEARGFDCVDKM